MARLRVATASEGGGGKGVMVNVVPWVTKIVYVVVPCLLPPSRLYRVPKMRSYPCAPIWIPSLFSSPNSPRPRWYSTILCQSQSPGTDNTTHYGRSGPKDLSLPTWSVLLQGRSESLVARQTPTPDKLHSTDLLQKICSNTENVFQSFTVSGQSMVQPLHSVHHQTPHRRGQ